MTDPNPNFVYLDYEDVRANLSDGAVIGGVRYRSRPRDRGCLHAKAKTIAADRGMANVLCPCGHEWLSIKVWVPPVVLP